MKLLVPAAVALLLVGCDAPAPATAPDRTTPTAATAARAVWPRATAWTETADYAIDETHYAPCSNGGAGEQVALSGGFKSLLHVSISATDAVLIRWQVETHLGGTGEITGNRYVATGVEQEIIPLTGVIGSNYSLVKSWRLVSQGSEPDAVVRATFHFTVTPSGAVVGEHRGLTMECLAK